MPLQDKFNRFTTASPVLVSFDSTDISSGTGYEDYFLLESEDSGGKDYHLTPQREFSNSVKISLNQSTFDEDFTLSPFIFPRTINGDVIISLAAYTSAGTSPRYTAELYKVVDGSETQLGSTVFLETSFNGKKMFYMIIPIENQLIAAGDSLRVRVIMANPSSAQSELGIDPAGRSDAQLSIPTASKISVPFNLDL